MKLKDLLILNLPSNTNYLAYELLLAQALDREVPVEKINDISKLFNTPAPAADIAAFINTMLTPSVLSTEKKLKDNISNFLNEFNSQLRRSLSGIYIEIDNIKDELFNFPTVKEKTFEEVNNSINTITECLTLQNEILAHLHCEALLTGQWVKKNSYPELLSHTSFATNKNNTEAKKISILIVEDNIVIQKIYKRMLTDDYTITTVSDGLEAVELYQEFFQNQNFYPFDIILMDIQMPRMDGFAATKKIRTLIDDTFEASADIYHPRIITLTANKQDKAKALERGSNNFLTKPVNKNLLLDTITEELENKKNNLLHTEYEPEVSLSPESGIFSQEVAYLDHQFRNTLQQMRHATEELFETANILSLTRDISKFNSALKALSGCADHQKLIMQKTLDLWTIESGGINMQEYPFTIDSDIRKAIEEFTLKNPKLLHKKLLLKVNLPSQPIHLIGDSKHFIQIFHTLFENAIEYTESGSIHINLSTQLIENDYIETRLTITDTGKGIDPTTLPDIFKPFRVPPDCNNGHAHLALPIAKRLAASLQGDLTVTSELGKGSTFCLQSTFKQDHFPGKDLAAELSPRSITCTNVLLAQARSPTNKAIQRKLKHNGFEVKNVSSTLAAIEASRHKVFNLILIGTECTASYDGFNAAETISREQSNSTNAPIIMGLTTDNKESTRRNAMEAGMDACVNIPCNNAEILHAYQKAKSTKTKPQFNDSLDVPKITDPRAPNQSLFLTNEISL